jgi:hypothetical protein
LISQGIQEGDNNMPLSEQDEELLLKQVVKENPDSINSKKIFDC